MKDPSEIVTTESAVNLQSANDYHTEPNPLLATEYPKMDNVITENTEPKKDIPAKVQIIEDTGRPKASLPGIGVFLNKTCTIPLVRCDFDTIKTAVESRDERAVLDNTSTSNVDHDSPTPRTSTRKRTVIDYKKFLEEFADLPPSPPRKK